MSISTTLSRIIIYFGLTIMFVALVVCSVFVISYMSITSTPRSNVVLESSLEALLAGGSDDTVVEIKDLTFSRPSIGAPINVQASMIRLYPKDARKIGDTDAIISPSLQTNALNIKLSPFNIITGGIIIDHIDLQGLQLFGFISENDRYVSAFNNDEESDDNPLDIHDSPLKIAVNPLAFLGYVGSMNIKNGLVLALDEKTGQTTNLARLNIDMHRIETFKQSLLTMRVFEGNDLDQTLPTFDLTITSTDDQDEAEMVAYIGGFNWRDIIPWIGTLNRTISEASGKVNGDLRLQYNKDSGAITSHNFNIKSDEGRIAASFTNDSVLTYNNVAFVSNRSNTSLSAILAGREMSAQLNQNDDNAYNFKGFIPYIRAEDIAAFWPESDKSLASEWITQKLKEGAIKNLDLSIDVKKDDQKQWAMSNVVANFETENLWVRYLSAFEPISALNAKGRYENDTLFIDIQSALVSGLNIKNGAYLEVSNLTKQKAGHLLGNLQVNGPVSGVLNYLDNDIIRYKERISVVITDPKGNADLDVKLDFPTVKDVAKELVKVNVTGTLNELLLPNIIDEFNVSGGPYTLEASESFLRLNGQGAINKAPSDIAFETYFSADNNAPYEMKFNSKGTLTPDFLAQTLGQTFAKIMATPSQYSLEFMQPFAGSSSLKLDVSGNNFAIGSADFQFGNGFDFKGATLNNIKLGQTNGNLVLSKNANNGMNINFNGPLINAEPFIKARDKEKNSAAKSKDDNAMANNNLMIKAGRVLGSNNLRLDNFNLDLAYNNKGEFSKLNLDAMHNNAPLKVRFLGSNQGDSLDVNIKDAGALLKGLDVTDGVRGGTVVITGNPNGSYGSIKGRAEINNFTASNVPVLGRLVNAISVPGLLQLLTSDGIDFSRLESDFVWSKRQDGVSVLEFKNGRTRGSSLGLTFEGLYYPKTEILNLSGNVVPLSTVNDIISAVPILGNIISGGKDSSLVAVNYTMKGPAGDPNVFVNPLSILAPGILRRILFEGGPEASGNSQQKQIPANQVAQ